MAATPKPQTLDKRVAKWVADIIAGKITASRWLIMAAKRYRDDRKNAKRRGWFFDVQLAASVVRFMESLKHTKGKWKGEPFILSPLQLFVVWNLFGFRRLADGLRRFSSLYLTVARKWGKSTFAAALAIVLLFFDTPLEAEAECYVAATKSDQAARIVTQAARMVENQPTLSQMATPFKLRETVITLLIEPPPYNGSFLKAIGADSTTADAYNPSLTIRDEVHALRPHHSELMEKLETAGGSRAQPVDLVITTAGSDESYIWMAMDEYAQKVLASASDNSIDDSHLVIICRIDETRPCECGGSDPDCPDCDKVCPDCNGNSNACKTCDGVGRISDGQVEGDDPLDEKHWPKANPDLGVTPSVEYLRKLAAKARHSPGFMNAFRRFHCNLKVESTAKIIPPAIWAQCRGKLSDWKGNSRGAWDVGLRDDLASIAVCCEIDGVYEIRQISLIPQDGPRDLRRPPFPKLIESGRVIVTPGDTTDFDKMKSIIVDWSQRYGVTDWAFDRSHSRQMASDLMDQHGLEVFEFGQTYSMFNEPMREFVKRLKTRQIVHDGDQLLAWAAGNLVARVGTQGEWRPDKLKSPEKIDPIVAVIMAFGRCLLAEPAKKSVYKRRGIITA